LIFWFGWISIYLTKSALPPVLPLIIDELGITYAQAGLLETAYLMGYVVIKLPIGILDRRLGSKGVMTLGIFGYAVSSLLISRSSGYLDLFVLRFLVGLFQGVHLPIANSILSRRFGELQGRAIGFHESGPNVGNTLAFPLTVSIASTLGWRCAFIFLSLPAFLLAAIVFIVIDEGSGESIPSREEGGYSIRDYMDALIPFTIAHATYNILLRTLFAFIPTYLVDYRGMTVASAGLLAMILPAAGILSKMLSGYIGEYLGGVKAIVLAIFLSGMSLLTMTLIRGDIPLTLVFAMLGLTLYSFSPIIYSSTTSTLPPGIKSTGLGMVTIIGNLTGAVSTTFIGGIIDLVGFKIAFIFLSFLSISLSFVIHILGNRQNNQLNSIPD
jgi:predicted MFS family arabinose efflux permease